MRMMIRLVFCWPAVFLGAFVARMVCGVNPTIKKLDGVAVVIFNRDSFAARVWPYATTLGYVIICNPRFNTTPLAFHEMLVHEKIHVHQFESVCVGWGIAAALSAAIHWQAGATMAILSPFCWLIFYVGASIVAWTHGLPSYRGNVFERHAYLHASVNKNHRI